MSKIGTPVVKNMFAKKKAKGAKVAVRGTFDYSLICTF
jgi:hypothetical protein